MSDPWLVALLAFGVLIVAFLIVAFAVIDHYARQENGSGGDTAA